MSEQFVLPTPKQLEIIENNPKAEIVGLLVDTIRHLRKVNAEVEAEIRKLEETDPVATQYAYEGAKERLETFLCKFEPEVELFEESWWLKIKSDADPATIEDEVRVMQECLGERAGSGEWGP